MPVRPLLALPVSIAAAIAPELAKVTTAASASRALRVLNISNPPMYFVFLAASQEVRCLA